MPWKLVVVALSIAAFLAAAKAHGRQVRVERLRAGHAHVVFGGQNDAYVETLWRGDRVVFWATAGAVLTVVGAALALGLVAPLGGGLGGVAWALFFPPMWAGFLVCGLWHVQRFVASRALDPAFTQSMLPGSAAWFGAALVLVAAALYAAWRAS